MIAFDTMGRQYHLQETNLGGGEGKLCMIDGYPNLCAKVFKNEKRTRGKEAKILGWKQLLSSNSINSSFCNQVVIPRDCLYSQRENQSVKSLLGYTMEKLTGFRTLQDIYEKNDVDFIQRVWIARNLCILTNRVHSLGDDYVVGDYNTNNVAVFLSTSTAKFIDVDSFQLVVSRNGQKVFCPCNAAVPEFVAPEVSRRLRREKTDLESITQSPENPVFTQYTDRYALAYHIFALLMNGSAPFAAMVNMEELAHHPSMNVSSVDVSSFRAADKGDFVFAKKSLFKKPPEYAPSYDILSPTLKDLFERAFIAGAKDPKLRPDSSEFYSALSKYLNCLEMRPCGHVLPSFYTESCEWCRISHLS